MKMRDGHCQSCRHAVIEIAGGVSPQEVLQIIANICLYVHMYVLLGHARHQVCVFVP